MNAVGSVDQMCIVPIPLCHRALAPFVECLSRESEDPAGHRDRNSIYGEVADQRYTILG